MTQDSKHLLLIVLLALIGPMAFGQSKPAVDPDFHVYLLTGQSNMAGRGPLDSMSAVSDPQIFMLDKNEHWVPAKDPVHFDKPEVIGVGPAIAFAKAMLGGNKKIRIGLIPCAVGGSSISVWEPDSIYLPPFHPYDDAIRRARTGMRQGVLKGIIWHQGEADNNPESAAVYLEKLKILIRRMRGDLGMPELPFVAGEIGYFNKVTLINAVIDSLPQTAPHTAVVSAKGLTDKGDQVHFNTTGARELGRRYAEAMKKLQEKGRK